MELGCGGEPSPGHAREGVEAGPVCAQPALPRPSMAGGEQVISPLSKEPKVGFSVAIYRIRAKIY